MEASITQKRKKSTTLMQYTIIGHKELPTATSDRTYCGNFVVNTHLG